VLPIMRTHDEVHVARMEPERDATVRLVEGGSVPPDRPVTGKRPVVASQHLWGLVLSRDVRSHAAGRGEVLRLTVSEVGLHGLQTVPVGLHLGTKRVDLGEVVFDLVGSGVGQELPDDDLVLAVVALAESMVPDASLGVDEVKGRSVVIRERVPDAVVAIDRDRVPDPHIGKSSPDIVDVFFE
jgi:hypothetical protein